MNRLKKALAIFMTVLMVVSMMNVGASAATYTATIQAGSGEGSTLKEGITEDMLILTTDSRYRVTLPDEAYFERADYFQDGWTKIASGNGSLIKFGSVQTVKNDTVVYYPHWKQSVYTFTFGAGRNSDETDIRNYTDSTMTTLKEFIIKTDVQNEEQLVFPDAMFYRVGYTQTGWTTSVTGMSGTMYGFGSIYDGTMRNTKFYPYWTINTYAVTYLPGQYGTGNEATVSVDYNTSINFEDAIFTREGYTQMGWSLVDGGDMDFALGQLSGKVTEDITLYPYWEENQCGSNFYHTWENGVCAVCGKVCGTDVEHIWENGECTICSVVCGTDVEHTWENGICTICSVVCGTDTDHVFEDRVCTICGIVCGTDMEHTWKIGVCSTCGLICEHTFENGICSVCGNYEPAILVTAENYESLNLDESYIGYYAIASAAHLHWFRDFVNSNKQLSGDDTEEDTTDDVYSTSANAVLINDIDLNPGVTFVPKDIVDGTGGSPNGTYDENGNPVEDVVVWEGGIGLSDTAAYEGIFDGRFFKIKGFASIDTGLFLYNNGTIKNLNISNGGAFSINQLAGVFCWVNTGEILNCSNYSGTITLDNASGGICAYNQGGKISGCTNYGSIDCGSGICLINEGVIENCCNRSAPSIDGCPFSGIVYVNYGTTKNCYNIADLTGIRQGGGICISNYGLIENCYNTGNISSIGQYYGGVGGICGESEGGAIKNCYNTGTITSENSYVGAICGMNTDTTIENCYYLKGCATDGNGVAQYGIGNATLGTATEDVDGATIAKTAEQFASGEVCYILNGGVTDGTQTFYQNLDNGEEVDSTPVFSGGTVYKVGPCTGIKAYTNIEADVVCEHNWESGVCSNCELVCEHTWENGKCTNCSVICGVDVDHSWVNGECSICGAVCGTDVAHTWKDGVCSVCSENCEHGSYDSNGFCAICGFAYEPAILGTEENYEELGLIEDYIGYYAIKNAGQLYWFGELVNKNEQLQGADTPDDTTDDIYASSSNGVLLNDIDINPGYTFNSDGTVTYEGKAVTEGFREWVPIGDINTKVFYSGVFDGNDYSVKGVYIKNIEEEYAALFFANFGTIKRLGTENSFILCELGASGICASNAGIIRSCYSSAHLCSMGYIGGICGGNADEGVISDCYFDGSFSHPLSTLSGGICGSNDGTVTKCYNLANIVGAAHVAGICGENRGTILNCYNNGEITGNPEEEQSCGIAGICAYAEEGSIKNCYNTGTIGKIGYLVGAICAYNVAASIDNCYYLEGCATDGNGVVQNGIGNETLGKATEDIEGATALKTAEQFASGEVCYLLNGGVTDGTQSFYQNLDNGEEINSTPVFSGGTVYKVGPCTGVKEYTNIEADAVCEHIWGNDVCSTCGLSMLKSVSDKTKIDHTGKSIFTELLLCKSLDEIVTVIEGYTTKLTASFGDYIGTGSTVEVLDSDANTVSTYTVVVENDVNGDSVCDVLDCAQVARVTSGYDSFDGAYKLAADSDNNGEIDINDYQAIVNAALQ